RQRLPGRHVDRGEGEAVLRWTGRGEVVRRRRRRVLGATPTRAGGAALGDGRRYGAGAGHLGVRRVGPWHRPLPLVPAWHARRRPGPRGRRATVEAAHDPRPVPRLVGCGDRPRDQGRRPGRCRHQGRGRRRVVHARADGAHRDRAPRPHLTATEIAEGADPHRDRRLAGRSPQREAAFFMMADLRFAAWFLWITPLDTALSSLRLPTRRPPPPRAPSPPPP